MEARTLTLYIMANFEDSEDHQDLESQPGKDLCLEGLAERASQLAIFHLIRRQIVQRCSMASCLLRSLSSRKEYCMGRVSKSKLECDQTFLDLDVTYYATGCGGNAANP